MATDRGSEIHNVGLVDAEIVGSHHAGALVGQHAGTITNAYSTGDITGHRFVGGLVGTNNGIISQSYSSSTVTGEMDGVGGLAGTLTKHDYLPTYIENSYRTGAVTGRDEVGGLVGSAALSGDITNSYSTGKVVATRSGTDKVGGLVGYNNGKTYVSSYRDVESSGQLNSYSGDGKTTAQMRQMATFVDWDFDLVWSIDEGSDYPDLRGNPRR